jgi:hypothetical protein
MPAPFVVETAFAARMHRMSCEVADVTPQIVQAERAMPHDSPRPPREVRSDGGLRAGSTEWARYPAHYAG